MNSIKTFLLLLTVAAITLTACSSAPRQAQAHEIVMQNGYTLANVTDIEVHPNETDPSQVEVWATGPLPGRCVKIGQVFQDRVGNDITVVLTSESRDLPGCDDGITAEFVQISPLEDLLPGAYTVTIHGITKAFNVYETGVVVQ